MIAALRFGSDRLMFRVPGRGKEGKWVNYRISYGVIGKVRSYIGKGHGEERDRKHRVQGESGRGWARRSCRRVAGSSVDGIYVLKKKNLFK